MELIWLPSMEYNRCIAVVHVLAGLCLTVGYTGSTGSIVAPTEYILKCTGQLAEYSNTDCAKTYEPVACYTIPFVGIRSCGRLCDGVEHWSVDEERCQEYCEVFADQYCQLHPKFSSIESSTTPQLTKPKATTVPSTEKLPPKETEIDVPEVGAAQASAQISWEGLGLGLVIGCGVLLIVAIVAPAVVFETRRRGRAMQQAQEESASEASELEELERMEMLGESPTQETGLQGICQDPPDSERPLEETEL